MKRLRPARIAVKLKWTSLLKYHSEMAHFIHEAVTSGWPVPWFSGTQIFVPNVERNGHPQLIAGIKFCFQKFSRGLLQCWLLPAVRVQGFPQRSQTKTVPFPILVMLKLCEKSSM